MPIFTYQINNPSPEKDIDKFNNENKNSAWNFT
jgi:hypothetical protein